MNCSCSGQNNEHLSTENLERSNNETRDCQFIIQDKSAEKSLTINQLSDWQHYKQPIPLEITQVINCSIALKFQILSNFWLMKTYFTGHYVNGNM